MDEVLGWVWKLGLIVEWIEEGESGISIRAEK